MLENRKKILYIITGLNVGGAENMLYKLASSLDKNKYKISIICLINSGKMAKKLQALDVNVICMGIRFSPSAVIKWFKLIGIIKKENPDIVQTWMYHADLLGGLAAYIAGKKNIIWSIRQSSFTLISNKTKFIAKLCALLSNKIPKKIVSNSYYAKATHVRFGYSRGKIKIIPNGFEITVNKNEKGREDFRKQLHIPMDTVLFGALGRHAPEKGYPWLLDCISKISTIQKNFCLLIVGKNVINCPVLKEKIKKYNLQNRVYLLDEQENVAFFFSSIDCYISSSLSEGFSNALGEAMSFGLPCIVTRAGDSAHILNNNDFVVTPNDVNELSSSMSKMIDMTKNQRDEIGLKAKLRLSKKYELSKIVNQFDKLYQEY